MRTDLAGMSAAEAYLAARSQRCRDAATTALLVVGAAAAGWAAFQAAGGLRFALWAGTAFGLTRAWMRRPRPDPERWLRGAAGEAATALLLDRLPGRRWVVLHDRRIPGSRANLDHLVIGPTGVWVVDTKTTRAVVRAGWRTVRFGDRRLDPGPARWEAQVVVDRLATTVRPLIVVHGHGLSPRGGRSGGVRVVPAGGLLRRLRRGRRRLDRGEVVRLAARAEAVFRPASGRAEGGRASLG